MRYEYLLRLAAFILAAGSSLLPADEPDFASQVAPILRQHCVRCHNDDERSGELSLHTAKDLVAAGHLGTTNAVTSPLIKQITPVDGEAAMPQDAPPLTAEQIAIITKWLDAGAAWPPDVRIELPRVTDFDWWSYRPLQLPAVPKRSDDWVRTPIDAFVLEELQTRGLSPTKEADRRTLIRRVSYDLTGLPPTPEETQAFINNSDPQAYEQLVDRLLDSKHYGERWARHWLDVVKYADTCGYDKDKLRPQAWPYRDYVIDSFNEDKPYSQFVQEQIAGDALFPGQPDGILGLGFIAAGPWDFIGHVEVSESKIDGKVARNLDRDDMVANAINTFCSVTVQCARCHHHKFDPITQQDYYGLQAVFAAVDRANRPYDLDPATETERRALESQLAETLASQRELEQAIASEGGDRLAKLNAELQRLAKDTKVEKDQAFGYHSAIASRSDAEKWVQVDLGDAHEVAKIVLRPCHDDFAGIGSGFGFPKRFRIDTSLDAKEWVTIYNQTEHDYDASDLSPCEVSALAVEARYVRVTATKLSERKNDFILALAELAVLDQDQALLSKQATVTALDSIEAPVRWARRNLTDGKWADWTSPERGQQLATAKRQRKELLQRIETPARVERRQTLEQKIQQTRQAIEKLPKGKLVYAAATDFSPQGNFKPTQGTPRAVHVLHRGDVQHPRAMAQPGVLPLPGQDRKIDADASESQRRAALAKWLVDDAHPLVWRSIVNRIWQYHFGQGIVATPNDFGRMGALPTHPQLLDWLAIQFRDGGQSFKALHRMMVTSSVYRQASSANPTNQAIDGGNQYLWRMNRRRLSAEEIRDSILLVSGALDRKMGGPGFYLFELEKTAHSPHYEYHKFDPRDPASHRRSIYRFIVRSQPDPWMTTLDCADSSQSTPRRNETLTSLQALSLLNNPFNLVMAETFAEHLKATEDRLPAQVDRAVEQTLQRTTEAEERQAMIDYAQTHGLENLCRLLFNLSEFVFVD